MDRVLTIGKLSEATGLPAKTIWYYESIGLIPRAPRTASRYRVYSEKDVRRLEVIRRARLLDLSLRQIGELIQWAAGEPCNTFQGHLLELVTAKLEEVDRKVQDLTLLKSELEQLERSLSQGEKLEEREDHTVMECPSCQCFGDQTTNSERLDFPATG